MLLVEEVVVQKAVDQEVQALEEQTTHLVQSIQVVVVEEIVMVDQV
jgi:hypothetical protein